MKARTYIFFGGVAVLMYLRLMYQASFFPPYFEGEEGRVLDLAKASCDFAAYMHSWWDAIKGGLEQYNKGYSWFLVPFYLRYGYDVRLITYVLPVFFSLYCAAFFTIYRRTYPASSLLSFALVAVFSVLCLCLRRYKWHTMTYLTALSVYLYFLPQFYNDASVVRDGWRKAIALTLFALSCFLYFGGLIYAAPFLILVVVFGIKARRRRELVAACVGVLVFLMVSAFAYNINNLWGHRIRETVAYAERCLSPEGLKVRWWSVRDFFFTLYLSPPYLAFFVVGVAASVRRIRRGDNFALVNTTLLGCLLLFDLTIEGLNNPDQLNWSMVPILGVLLIGADTILTAVRDNLKGGALVAAALALLVAWNELRFFRPVNRDALYQSYVQSHNTRTQAALVLMMIRDDDSGTAQYFLPDPSVPEAQGGFDYSVSLLRADFGKAFARIVYFTGEEDLRGKLAARSPSAPAVVYLSVPERPPGDGAADPAQGTLLGQRPQIIHPFEDVYGIPFPVRKFRFPGAASARLPAGPAQPRGACATPALAG